MRIDVRLSSPVLRVSDKAFAQVVRTLLEAVAQANVDFLREYPNTPPLYKAGVVYEEEPPGVEEFLDIPEVYSRGATDCANLCAWRVAELRKAGVKARFRLIWTRTPRGRIFHVQVRHPNGRIEDPSVLLGMNADSPG